MKNIVNAKYSTKNNKIYSAEVFFAATNQIRAIKSSIRNFIPVETNECMAWASCSRDNPLLKTRSDKMVETANENTRDITATSFIPSLNAELTINEPNEITRNSMRRGKKYFRYSFIT
jgi:hypothetical protein